MSEPSWSAGYPVDRDYDYVFVPQMTPASLALVALQQGLRAPDASRFRYFELGAGFGMMSLLMAAANPDAEVWANDFMPNHVLEARTIAEEASLSNAHFLEDSFEELVDRELPEFDFIGLHGVYSWVSEANRRAIVEFIRRRLKTGGLVYVSYNSPAGFGPIAPLRQLMNSVAAAMGGTSERHVRQAFDVVSKLAEVKASYLGLNQLMPGFERVKKRKLGYLVGEFFTRNWNLFLHTDVAKELADAKLSYVASARLLDDLLPLTSTPQQIEMVRQIPDRGVQENVKDFLAGRTLRRDAFARGTSSLGSAKERLEALFKVRFVLLLPRASCSYNVNVQDGDLTLLEHVHGPLLDELGKGPSTLAELVETAALKSLDHDATANALLALVAVGYAAPYVEPTDKAKESSQRLNNAIFRRAAGPRPLPCVAAPATGHGLVVSQTNQVLLQANRLGADPIEYAGEQMQRAGKRLMRDGKPIENADEHLLALRNLEREFRENEAPLFRRLGIMA